MSMRKVKIVQIAKCYDPDGNEGTEYLDDAGRVWYDAGHFETVSVAGHDGIQHKKIWLQNWMQLTMPEEPRL